MYSIRVPEKSTIILDKEEGYSGLGGKSSNSLGSEQPVNQVQATEFPILGQNSFSVMQISQSVCACVCVYKYDVCASVCICVCVDECYVSGVHA